MPITRQYSALTGQVSLIPASTNLASGSAVAGNVINNVQGNGTGASPPGFLGYPFGQAVLSGTLGGAPTAGTSVRLWFLRSVDQGSSNFEAGTAGSTPTLPTRDPDTEWAMDTSQTTLNFELDVEIPPGYSKPLVYQATGQQITNLQVKLAGFTDQGISS
jgi:hypothetical protein